jgi:hypothetical protein
MRKLPLAEALRPKNPCHVGFGTMTPVSPRERFCASCERHVVDVSKLTRAAAIALVARRDRGEEVCVHLEVRVSDGAIRVADGHVLPPAKARSGAAVVAAASSVMLAACGSPEPNVPTLPKPPTHVVAPVTEAAPQPPPTAPPPSEAPEVAHAPAPATPPKKGHGTNASAPAPSGPTTSQPQVYVDVDGDI